MSIAKRIVLYVLLDVVILAGLIWAAFIARWPAREVVIPATLLFVLNGIWLIVMAVKNTPPRA
ncbi:MAG: hypothetical protein ACRD4F_01060 [Candidatus Angelobacter sp.]|jgi:hypothetical protein